MPKTLTKLENTIILDMDKQQTHNPLLVALKENDRKNLFHTNVSTVFIKTGFPLIDYYFGSTINIHDDLGKLIRQEPRIGQAAGTFNLIVGNSGTGKAQPLSTKIPTPDGYKLMGDIKVGDKVFDDNGKPCTVKKVFPQGVKDIYKVTFEDGRTSLCCEDHLWEVFEDSTGRNIMSVKPLKEIIKDYKDFDDPESIERKYKIRRLSKPVEYNYQDVPTDPHLIGTMICPMVPYEFIPDCYLYNDVNTRMKLLQGLMDKNGIISHINGISVITYSSYSEKLLTQIQQLIQGLGYHASITINHMDDMNYGYYGTLTFFVPANFKRKMFTYTSKLVELSSDIDNSSICGYDYLDIDEIEFVRKEEAQCIMVDSFHHLYVTENFIVTHNTTLAEQIAGNMMRQYKFANTIHFDCENRTDISRVESVTQLPSYYFRSIDGTPEQYMLIGERVGLDVIQKMIVDTFMTKVRLKDQLYMNSGFKDEFGRPIMMYPPTIVIIDSITSVLNETYSTESTKDMNDASKLRANTEGARDAKSLKGFLKDVIPMCKEANIIIYGINHINQNMSMNSFLPVAKQQIFLKQEEIIPGGRTMIFYPYNIMKLVARPSDNFTEAADGFDGHMVMIEPIKSSSNQSGNDSKGVSFEMVFAYKRGFDSLRSNIMYGRKYGLVEGNKNRMKFKDNKDYTFTFRNIYKESKEKPIWEDTKKIIIPHLNTHLSYIEPSTDVFDMRSLAY